MPPPDAIRRLSDVLARDPGSPAALELAELLAGRGDVDAARRVATQAAARHPLRAEAHDLVARLAMRQEDWRAAHEAWCRVLSLAGAGDARRAGAWLGRAYVAFREGRPDAAEEALTQAEAAGASPDAVAAARARLRAEGTPGAAATALVAAVEQAAHHLGLGAWRQVVVEADGRHVAIAPSERGVAVVAAPAEEPLGLTLRRLDAAVRAVAAGGHA